MASTSGDFVVLEGACSKGGCTPCSSSTGPRAALPNRPPPALRPTPLPACRQRRSGRLPRHAPLPEHPRPPGRRRCRCGHSRKHHRSRAGGRPRPVLLGGAPPPLLPCQDSRAPVVLSWNCRRLHAPNTSERSPPPTPSASPSSPPPPPQEDVFVARAPGRLDAMGGIADYSGALVLQMPLAEACHVAVQCRPRSSSSSSSPVEGPPPPPTLRIVSFNAAASGRDAAFSIELSQLVSGWVGWGGCLSLLGDAAAVVRSVLSALSLTRPLPPCSRCAAAAAAGPRRRAPAALRRRPGAVQGPGRSGELGGLRGGRPAGSGPGGRRPLPAWQQPGDSGRLGCAMCVVLCCVVLCCVVLCCVCKGGWEWGGG